MLAPIDVIAGARISGHPGIYVLGIDDTRITFYAQQVRALELAHALHVEHYLRADARVAVVGGGAAGITFAAALALQGSTRIDLFESSHHLLPLQGDAQRRRLDPHIYDWPEPDADHELAQLPILDWRSGAAREVRNAVLHEFHEVRSVTAGRLTVKEQHKVTAISPSMGGFTVHYEREGQAGDRLEQRQEFDIVVLAIGFGVEPRFAIPFENTPSYWHDAGVPGAEIGGNPRPTFLVSGNGDGGLIDLIACASATFRHDEIVRGIAQRAGSELLRNALLRIDDEARLAEARGVGFDFVAAYDRDIRVEVERLGLVAEMRARLRPGVQLFFQTRKRELFSIKTARLNRLAVYLLQRACNEPIAETFTHVICEEVVRVASLAGDRQDSRRFQCGPTSVAVDWLIARRGPFTSIVRDPFANILADYTAEHGAWTRRFPSDSISPKLNPATRSHFNQLALRATLPPPRHQLNAVLDAMPQSGKLWIVREEARWSGDLDLERVGTLWSNDSTRFDLTVIDAPDRLGLRLAHAIARLLIHAPAASLLCDIAQWEPFLRGLSSESPSASGLQLPRLRALGDIPSILNPHTMPSDDLATEINRALDLWLLDAIDQKVTRYLGQGEDPGRAVSFVAATDLRQKMDVIWRSWVRRFRQNPDLLTHFLCLAVCAKEDLSAANEASALVGRQLLAPLVRACVVALAVASAWQVTGPSGVSPGNLRRGDEGGDRTGHACVAGFIDSEEMTLTALSHAWSTEFVLLPMQSMPPEVMERGLQALGKTDDGIPSMSTTDAPGVLMLALDSQFRSAAKISADALCQLLLDRERAHYSRLSAGVQRA